MTGANAFAIEPIQSTIPHLEDHIRLNRVDDLVKVAVVGISDKPGEIWFTGEADALNHVTSTPGPNDMRVPVTTLDALTEGRAPICIKVDVENHEHFVIAGASKLLASPNLEAVLIETTSDHRTSEFFELFTRNGLHPHAYDPATRTLQPRDTFNGHNTLFIRNREFVQDWLRSAPAVQVGDLTL